MPFKRTRIGNCSTLFPSDVSSPVVRSEKPPPQSPLTSGQVIRQPYNPKKVAKQADAATIDQSRRTRILTMSTPPVQQEINVGARLEFKPTGRLSDGCYYCHNKFAPNMDMFMYRGLAFCKVECRNFQIELDSAVSQQYADLKKQMDQEQEKLMGHPVIN